MACTCGMAHEFKTQSDLHGFDFIALVKVKSLAPWDTAKKILRSRKSGNIGIEVIELFKGEKADTVYDENFENDCALSLAKGVEWIFFGYKREGKIYVSKCNYSVQYRTTEGYRDWQSLSGIKQLSTLRNIYRHATPDPPDTEFYPNGNIELKQSFKNGLLNGERKIYYPDGKLWIVEDFKGGKRMGSRDIYAKTGQLIQRKTYNDGYVNEMIAYHDTAETSWFLHFKAAHPNDPLFFGDTRPQNTLKQLDSLQHLKNWQFLVMYSYKFSDKGYSYHFYACDFLGRMERSADMDWQKQVEITYEYNKDGTVAEYMKYDNKAKRQTGYNDKHHIFDGAWNLGFNNELSVPEMVCVQ